jgi:integron integrase
LRERLRYMHYSLRTEQAYVHWTRAFIRFHQLKHPRDMGSAEVESFLTHLATHGKVSISTHRQALSALLYLYREVLDMDLPWMEALARPAAQRRIPAVMTIEEVASLLQCMQGETGLLARLLYGTGMRLMEGVRLRVKDLDLVRRVITVRAGKGGKDRVVMLPQVLHPALSAQLEHARSLWSADRAAQQPGVETPHALDRKYPRAGETWAWFWVFPAPTLAVDPRSGVIYTHVLKMAAGTTRSPLDALTADRPHSAAP